MSTPKSHGIICTSCPGDCLDACFNEAIVALGSGIAILEDLCAGCGACVGSCPNGHIGLDLGVARILAHP